MSTQIHSQPLAATAPNAKLIVLPGVGHMIQHAAPDLVIAEIEAMMIRDGAGCDSGGSPLGVRDRLLSTRVLARSGRR